MKIFCIGLPRTGTTTFHTMMKRLGYNSTSNTHEAKKYSSTRDFNGLFNYIKKTRFNAFSDNPWPYVWKELADKYPNYKFINLTRDANDWQKSMVKMACSRKAQPAPWRLGVIRNFINDPNGDSFVNRNKTIRDYFSNKSNFVELNWNEHGYNELCTFLGKPIINKPAENISKFKTLDIIGLENLLKHFDTNEQKQVREFMGVQK